VCVLWNCLFGRGQLQRLSVDFAVNGINRKPHPTMGKAVALSRVKSHLVGRPQFVHLTTLPECWRPSAAVRGDLHVRVTSQRYTEMINEFLSPNLPPNSGTLWFQQDGATAHTVGISFAAFRRLFPQRVISRFGDVPWPPRSPDLTTPDFFLWAFLPSTRPTDLHALKENIREEIPKLLEETLQAVMRNFLTRVHLCIEEGGGHLKDIAYKK